MMAAMATMALLWQAASWSPSRRRWAGRAGARAEDCQEQGVEEICHPLGFAMVQAASLCAQATAANSPAKAVG